MHALLQTCSISGEIFGTPSPELMKALEGVDVRIYSGLGRLEFVVVASATATVK